jgi:transposase
MQEFVEHHDVGVLPARSRKPRDKAWVEKMVGIVYTCVFAPLRNHVFNETSSLNQALWDRLEELNNLPLQKDRNLGVKCWKEMKDPF